MDIYEIKAGYLGDQLNIEETETIPISWTTEVPPVLSAGEYAMWNGRWIMTLVPPMPPEPMYDSNTQRLEWNGHGRGREWLIIDI